MNLALKYFTLAEQGFLCTFLALKKKFQGKSSNIREPMVPIYSSLTNGFFCAISDLK